MFTRLMATHQAPFVHRHLVRLDVCLERIMHEARKLEKAPVREWNAMGTGTWWQGELLLSVQHWPALSVNVTVLKEAIWAKYMDDKGVKILVGVFDFDKNTHSSTFSVQTDEDLAIVMREMRYLSSLVCHYCPPTIVNSMYP